VGIEGQYWPATEYRTTYLGSDVLVSVRRENVGLRACWNALEFGSFVAAPCLSPKLTYFDYETRGVLENEVHHTVNALLGVGLAADLRYEVWPEHLALFSSAGADLERSQPFGLRPERSATTLVELYTTTGLGARLMVGVDARF
jgi:hypothetical protein